MDLEKTLKKIKKASYALAKLSDREIRKILQKLAKKLEASFKTIINENKKDLVKIDSTDPIYDRILLDKKRISDMAKGIRTIAAYKSPIGIVLEKRTIEKGLKLTKVSTPLGVVGAIFEARPNVVIDIFALCFKSKNVCVLKGGSQSEYSNKILIKIIKESLGDFSSGVELLSNDRKIVGEFLQADKYIDVIIPRGGQNLIDFVRKNATVPVIETGAGVVHTYFDEFRNVKKGAAIIFNAKTSRPSVCNALDTLIINKKRLKDLGALCSQLAEKKVEIYADKASFSVLKNHYPKKFLFKAKEENFGKEYLSLKMSIKTVASVQKAIEHINNHGSGHSEAIITENQKNAEKFLNGVDAAAVYLNASTRFTDGGVYGLGAEVGISTQKLHARGPMGIKELTSYKWIVRGDGQVR